MRSPSSRLITLAAIPAAVVGIFLFPLQHSPGAARSPAAACRAAVPISGIAFAPRRTAAARLSEGAAGPAALAVSAVPRVSRLAYLPVGGAGTEHRSSIPDPDRQPAPEHS